MMKRDEMLKAFARQRKDEIVVAVYMAAQEIRIFRPMILIIHSPARWGRVHPMLWVWPSGARIGG
jgi:hypothetical protein